MTFEATYIGSVAVSGGLVTKNAVPKLGDRKRLSTCQLRCRLLTRLVCRHNAESRLQKQHVDSVKVMKLHCEVSIVFASGSNERVRESLRRCEQNSCWIHTEYNSNAS
jgi:hypothetical protein